MQQSTLRPLAPALLQLLGWLGFLGIGYLVQGRIGLGIGMLIGWWIAFWLLLAASSLTFGLFTILMICVWLSVPPITAAFLYFQE